MLLLPDNSMTTTCNEFRIMNNLLEDLYLFKEELGEPGLFFCLSGPISQNLMADIGSALERKMSLADTGKSTATRVFSMVVENAQNIIHYSAEKMRTGENSEVSVGIITVGFENGHYFVLSGNLVENEKIDKLRGNLKLLQNMNKNELKKYYRKKLKDGPHEDSKGAGVGFIEMAKKANAPFEFDFRKIDDRFSFFALKIIV